MTKKLCLIVGLDGFDPDVLVNLIAFYKGCGFDVRTSRVPTDADLLVIQRGGFTEGVVFEAKADEVHIYDYVFNGTSDYSRSFPNGGKVTVISPTGRVSGKGIPSCLIQSFHPVVTEVWTSSNKRSIKYDLVHIGHKKDNPGGDFWQNELHQLAKQERCHIWGNGWKKIGSQTGGSNFHNATSLHKTQAIYASARTAIGVMYSFQRGNTISGRMWQAPLNGCVLISESVPHDVALPGVVCVKSSSDFHQENQNSHTNRNEIIESATLYWDQVTNRLATLLGYKYKKPTFIEIQWLYMTEIFSRHILAQLR